MENLSKEELKLFLKEKKEIREKEEIKLKIKTDLEKKRQERKEKEEAVFHKEKIKDDLNKDRLKRQDKELKKKDILDDLNNRRLLRQKKEEVDKNRFEGKKIYSIRTFTYYKLKSQGESFYIRTMDAEKLDYVGIKINIYTRTYGDIRDFGEAMVKKDKKTEKILVSTDSIKVKYSDFRLERNLLA